MKRISIIFNSILLSLLIILVSSGVTLVQCNHTGNMSVAQLSVARTMTMMHSETIAHGSGKCCGMEPECHCCHADRTAVGEQPCMDYTLISSQPTNSVNGFNLDFHPLYTLLPDFFGGVVVRVPQVIIKSLLPECNGRHGPPRNYLRLITVLLI